MSSTLLAPKPQAHFEVTSDPSRAMRYRAAFADLRETFALSNLCWALAFLDIKLKYRGSIIGPFWLTLSTGVMIGAMGVLYAELFHMDMRNYFPFLALSIVLWNYMSALVTDSCMCFISAETLIRSVRMPFNLYAGRVVVRNVLILAHNVVVIIIVDLVLWQWPGVVGLLAIPALVLWLVVSQTIVLLLGAVCARFRDILPIVGSVMQIAFFVSGVIWQPSQLHGYEFLLALNPFFSLLEVLRGPLLGHVPSLEVYVSAVGYSSLLLLITCMLFARVRGRIAFWV